MSGSGGGGGYQYQAQAAAYIATHILAKRPLHWFDCISDVPIAVAEETDGPGDDIKITLQDCSVIELQAKHGLKKDGKFWEAIVKLIRGLVKDLSLYGVLLTNSRAIPSIRDELREDIIRLGQGREDNLKAITTEVIDRLNKERVPYDSEIFKRLRIVIVDLDDSIRNAKVALEVLSNVLHDPEQEGQSWSILCNDGLDLIKKRGQRNAESLSQLLGRHNIQLASSLAANSEREIGWQGWQQVCRSMLDRQIQFPTLNDLMAKDGVRIDPARLFVPIGLIERKQKQYRRSDVSSAEQASQLLQPTKEEIVRRFDQEEEFFNQVIGNPNISDNARFAITGEPGAGKTTLLQKIGDRLYEAGMLPVWISLGKRRVPPTYEFLSDVLKNNAQVQNYGSVDWNASIRALLQTGKVWFLLDGADELTTNGNPLQVIGSQLQEVWLGQVKVIVTCRLNAWDTHALPKFTVFRILEFDYQTPANGYRNQVEAYIHQFFEKEEVDPQLAPSLIQQLHTPGKERIRDLVKNPLRLSLLCYIWESGIGELPDTKAELYRLFIDYYYELQELKHPEISIDRTERDALNLALGEVAKTAFDSEDSRFRLRKRLIESISIMGKENAKGSLFDKAVRLGWLNYIGTTIEKPYESVYAFFHASFQEYFAALAIDDWDDFFPRSHQDKPIENCKGAVKYRIFEPQWQEVILLWLGRNEILDQVNLIDKLTRFNDSCGYFYHYRAYFLAALGADQINYFNPIRKLEIIRKIVAWGFDYTNTCRSEIDDFETIFETIMCVDSNNFDFTQQQWQAYTPIEYFARKIIVELNSEDIIVELEKIIENCNNGWYLEYWSSLAVIMLIEIAPNNLIALSAIIKILEQEGHSMRVDTIYELGESMIRHDLLISCLRNILKNSHSIAILNAVSYSLNKLLPKNEMSFKEQEIISKYLNKNLDLSNQRDNQKVENLKKKTLQVAETRAFVLNKIYSANFDPADFYSLYEDLWFYAQEMSYPNFYREWHSSSAANAELSTDD